MIVVNPLKARIERAIDATKPARGKLAPSVDDGSNEYPPAHRAAIANKAIPPIFSVAMTIENTPTDLFPALLTAYAKMIRQTPKTGIRTSSSVKSNARKT